VLLGEKEPAKGEEEGTHGDRNGRTEIKPDKFASYLAGMRNDAWLNAVACSLALKTWKCENSPHGLQIVDN
jgi:hypothetical protein